ncbi:1-acyl-sn-glycerol-3-phosphate acyltransferase [Mycoplasmoides fastidiosum]|uniref:1-acyl-sn-glycerol-3-phosphate acyltransferase n=1 Tax=Mycoplasmoides fastidiosum TaxID=92758 RepID=A0ABU0LZM9_9BACT|nr:lysophospholipid acyltransferase family protein [Mycoplasmoides fastidiosum]MDQ0514142.1 1-acyl-sn-glycerol-3-phosphate acyltransferase [Mycoplasmoides fastidiosum]UUD37450.1 1-acyl-sn-glycerol-3-phosphate acyltransferase [Mycoplasmoides fastidiosum]
MKAKILRFFKIIISPFLFAYIALKVVFAIWAGQRYVRSHQSGEAQIHAKQITNRHARVYRIINALLFYKNIEIEVKGLERVPKTPVLFLANHKSNVDSLVFYKTIYENKKYPLNTFVAKWELVNSKIGYILDLIDVIFIDRKNPRQALKQLEEEAPKILKNNRSLCIFPEATRVPGDHLGEFFPGSTIPAYQAFVAIVPVAIYNSEGQLWDKTKDGRIFHKPKSNKITIAFGKAITAQNFINLNQQKCVELVKNKVQDLYDQLAREADVQSQLHKSDHQEIVSEFKEMIKSKTKKTSN